MARTGIGAAYVQRQMAQGRSMASIQQEAANKGYTIGAKAQAMFSGGGGSPPAPAYSAPAPAAPAPRTGIGASYVQRELGKGRSLADIQQEAASKGYQIGEKAQAMFNKGGGGGGGGSSPAPASSGKARTGIGAAYVERELAKGRSLGEIKNEASRLGYQIGDKAQAMFNQGGLGGGGGVGGYDSLADMQAAAMAASDRSGRTGIGAAWVQGQLAAGQTLEEIKDHAFRRNWKVGDKAQALFAGGGTAPLDWLKTYRGAQGGRDSKGFGAAALQRARDAGRSDEDIQAQIAAGGWHLGPAARTALHGRSSVQDALKGQRNIWAHYDPAKTGHWGAEANTRALQAGLTRPEIISQLSESGLRIGDRAAKDLNVHAVQTTHIRPGDIPDEIDGYKTRYVLMPRDVRVDHLNRKEGDPDKYSTGAYAIGGYSDASLANMFGNFGDEEDAWDGPYKHGTRGTYQDSDWDYNIGGGIGHDGGRPNFYWGYGADKEALASHDDSWRGHGYDGRTLTPTQALKGRGGLKDATGWTAEHEKKLAARSEEPEETYNETFRTAAQDIADSTSSPVEKVEKIVEPEDSVLDNDGPVVEVMKQDDNPLASGSSGSSSGRPGTHAPYHLATGSAQYYRSRFG